MRTVCLHHIPHLAVGHPSNSKVDKISILLLHSNVSLLEGNLYIVDPSGNRSYSPSNKKNKRSNPTFIPRHLLLPVLLWHCKVLPHRHCWEPLRIWSRNLDLPGLLRCFFVCLGVASVKDLFRVVTCEDGIIYNTCTWKLCLNNLCCFNWAKQKHVQNSKQNSSCLAKVPCIIQSVLN